MQMIFSADLEKRLKGIAKKDHRLFAQIQKALELFSSTPTHPSLRIHKLHGTLQNFWSISITRDMRMVYQLEQDRVYFVDLGTHKEVYR